jgi:hypothetical protein
MSTCPRCGHRDDSQICGNCGLDKSGLAARAKAGMDAYDGGSCFIATEIYGREADEVQLLRQLRDRRLLPNKFGRRLVSVYYRVSPSIIPLMRRSSLVRVPLRALVAVCVFFVGLNRRP